MKELHYTLLSDGSSDQALIPILTWVLRQHNVSCAIQSQWADPRWLPRRQQKLKLSDRIDLSLRLYPCDLLFVHRDAEREPHQVRVKEIRRAIETSTISELPPAVCVVPVRMQEAWLLFDEVALRGAAGNPNGQQPLSLPPVTKLEQLPDPKSDLYEFLREASGLQGRRRRRFPVSTIARRVAEFINDFAPLRTLPAFSALEVDVESIVRAKGWNFTSEIV